MDAFYKLQNPAPPCTTRWYNMSVKLIVMILFMPTAAVAAAFVPDRLPPAAYADCEVSTNLMFNTGDADRRFLTIDLQVNGTPTNALHVAFGVDANADGLLAPEETQFRLGWECGAWFAQDERSGWSQRWPQDAAVRSLNYRLRYNRLRRPMSLILKDGGRVIYVSKDLPLTLFNPAWNCLRVTSRGLPLPDELVSVRNSNDATVIRIR